MQMTLFDRAIFDHGDIFFVTAQRCPTSVTNDVDPLVEVKAYLTLKSSKNCQKAYFRVGFLRIASLSRTSSKTPCHLMLFAIILKHEIT